MALSLQHKGLTLESTASTTSFRLLHKAMNSIGMDANEVYRKSGIDPEVILDPDARVPHNIFPKYWDAIKEVSGNKDIGLILGEHSYRAAINIGIMLLMTSATFGEGLERFLRYKQVMDSSYRWQLNVGEELGKSSLCFDLSDFMIPERMECIAVFFIGLFNWITDNKFRPSHICFIHPKPDSLAEHRRILGCELSFGQPNNTIIFDTYLLDTPSSHASSDLCSLHEEFAKKIVRKVSGAEIISKVYRELSTVLEHGPRDLNSISERMGMDPVCLQEKLRKAGVTFNNILDTLRRDHATAMLSEGNFSIREIVYLAGYSEPANFYRAFKRWEGMTPAEYQQKNCNTSNNNGPIA